MATVLPLWGVESKITQRGKLKGSVATINFQLGQYGCEAAEVANSLSRSVGGASDMPCLRPPVGLLQSAPPE